MAIFASLRPDGRVHSFTTTDPGVSVMVPPDILDPWAVYYHEGVWTLLPDNPDGLDGFDPVLGVWVDTRSPAEIEEAAKRAFDDAVNLERQKRLTAGTNITVPGYALSLKVPATDRDVINLQGLKSDAVEQIDQGDTTTPVIYRDADNVMHIMTPAQFVEMVNLGRAWMKLIYGASWLIKDMDPRPADHTDDALWPA